MSAFFRISVILFAIAVDFPCLGQGTTRLPKNLNSAVRILVNQIDSVNAELVKNSDLDALWDETFERASPLYIISQWRDDEHGFEGINRYLRRRGLEDYMRYIVLHAIKDQLTFGHYNEREILSTYCRKKCQNETQDRIRHTADSLYGNCIPADLEDCFRDLDNLLNDTSKRAIGAQSSEDFVTNSHHGLGTYLRNRWQLWGFSRLFFYFYERGICDPESMSGYILHQYHNHLTGQEIVRYANTGYCDSVEKAGQIEQKRIRDSTYATFRLKDTVRFRFKYGYSDDAQENSVLDEECQAIGLILNKDERQRLLRVKILSACSKKGIIIYDNRSIRFYDPVSKQYRLPAKRKKVIARDNHVIWTSYRLWELKGADEDF